MDCLAARALFLFGVSVVAGAVIGRALPALIVAGLLCGVALAAGENFYQSVLLRQEAVPVAMADYSSSGRPPLFFEHAVAVAGRHARRMRVLRHRARHMINDTGKPIYPEFQLVVPGTQYRWVEAREAAALVGGSIIAILFGGFVVQHAGRNRRGERRAAGRVRPRRCALAPRRSRDAGVTGTAPSRKTVPPAMNGPATPTDGRERRPIAGPTIPAA